MERPELKLGRTAFGGNPQAYDAARADYPARLFKLIRARCAIGPMTRAFEIGPGTGKATRPMLDLGLGSLIGVEPDARLAAYLRKELADPRLRLVEATFEAADLPEGGFDLGYAATSFLRWCACCGPAGTGQCGGTSTRTRNGPTRSAMR
jgi:SAM-dependent methyltransferase